MPGLLGAPDLFACLLKDPGLPWSDGLFLNPGLLGILGLLGVPDLLGRVCLKEMFCLLFFWLVTSLLIGAPTSSGGEILLLKSFVLDLFELWSVLFDICLFPPSLVIFWKDSLDSTLLIFLGLAISWKGGFDGVFIGGVVLFRKFFFSWLRFCEVLLFKFWFVGFIGLFEIIFWLSGLLRGLINNGFLFELSLRVFPFMEEITGDLFSLFCL